MSGFWVWHQFESDLFWFQDNSDYGAEYWRKAWATIHGNGVYTPVTGHKEDFDFTPSLKLPLNEITLDKKTDI